MTEPYDPTLNYRLVFLDEMKKIRENDMREEFESEHEDYGQYEEDCGPEMYNDNGTDF